MPRGLALITVATALLLAGCAGHSLDCLTGTSNNNCAPDTLGYQQMVQQQQGDDTVASIDDAHCRSYAAPGSKNYFDCRSRAASVRSSPQAR
jgi:hypothetical protein